MKKLQTKMLTGLLLVGAYGVARADFYPIPVTPGSYNADSVVEATATPGPLVPAAYTTASMDGGTNNNNDTWHEAGFFANETPVVSGLPTAGSIITSAFNANHKYQFAPSYVGPCAVMLDATYFTNASLNLTTPAVYGAISFLGSGGNGGCQFRATLRHADGSTEVVTNNTPDWFFVANPAYTSNGRCNAQSFSSDNYNSANPRLYERDNALSNTNSAITNIFIEFISGNASGHSGIMAISGQAPFGVGDFNPITVSGYNADIVVEASAGPPSGLLTNYVNVSMDGGTNKNGATWYERGFTPQYPLSGLPPAGSTLISSNLPDHQYRMAPSYAANNCIFVDSNAPSATFTFVTPTNLTGLAFLSANANGNVQVQVLINHVDATVETNTFTSRDWFNNSPAAYTANGRVNLDNRVEDSVRPPTSNPRIYESQFNLKPSATSAVSSVTLNWTTNGNPSASSRCFVFAVSGTTNPVAPLIVDQPLAIKTNVAVVVNFTSSASGTTPINYQWQKGTNGVYVNLVNGGNIAGATTTNLTVSNVQVADEADYRMVASNVAGNSSSQAAGLIVLSELADVTQPGDLVSLFGGTAPGAEGADHSIDNLTSKYLNFGTNGGTPFAGPVGFVVTPAMGRTRVTVMRLYTANDAPERDPATIRLEGSDNGGASYTLITSNNITMPDGRNAGGQGLDPINQNIVQVRFNNTNGYSLYRWTVLATKNSGAANAMQIGEVELLGVADTSGLPFFSQQPTPQVIYDGTAASFTAAATGTPTPGLRWQRQSGAGYVPMVDGGNVSGANTGNLVINPASFANATNYICIATNTSGAVTSVVVSLTIISTNLDVTQPSDTIVAVGDTTGTYWGTAAAPANAIDDSNSVKYQNGGSGFSAPAGFPPFQGPAGVEVTPGVGATRLVGIRVYTADGNPERDPVDYTLSGSTDGVNFTVISSGPLALPAARANNALPFDPLQQPLKEVLFSNPVSYTSYRLTFLHTANDNVANSIQVGEIELLGQTAPLNPVLKASRSGNDIVLTSTIPGTLQSSTNVVSGQWVNEGPISGSVTITPSPLNKIKVYRVVVP